MDNKEENFMSAGTPAAQPVSRLCACGDILRKKKRGIMAGALFLMLTVTMTGIMARLNMDSQVLHAARGVITVDADALNDAPYMLTGQWLRYRGALTPEELPTAFGEYVDDIRCIRKMRGYTYWFRMEVYGGEELSFAMKHPGSSRMWVNGIEVFGENGTGITQADEFSFHDYGKHSFEFVMQVVRSGVGDVYQGLLVGKGTSLKNMQNLWLVLDLVAIGLYIMLILLCFSLFARKRSERYLLLLVVAALAELGMFLLMSRSSLIASYAVGSEVFYRQLAFIYYFICKQFVPNKAPKWMDAAVWSTLALSVLGCAAFPPEAVEILRLALYIYILCQLYLLLVGFAQGIGETVSILLGAALLLGNEIFYELLYAGIIPQGVVDVQVMPAQYLRLAYVLGFAVATCLKFARKYQEAEVLSSELEARVRAQTRTLTDAHEKLLQEQKQRQRFVTGIAHNLKSPLFALSGNLELLRDELRTPTAEEGHYLDQMDKKLDYINRMVNDMLLVSRLEDGDIRFRFTEFDLAALLEGVAHDARFKGAARKIGVVCEVTPQTLRIAADQFRLKQALDNLADNAVRFSPDGGTVSITGAAVGENLVRILVQDEGPGVDLALQETLFSREKDGREPGTSGIGLVVVRQIAGRHGGRVYLMESGPCGSIFALELPITQPIDTP